MDLQTMLAAQTDSVSTPALFNLVDLIIGSLKSPNQQTIGATLQLLSVILRRHHRYAMTTLLKVGKAPVESTSRTIGAHETELEYLMGLVDGVGIDHNIEGAYEAHMKDSMALLEGHPCSQSLVAPKSSDGLLKSHGQQTIIPGAPKDVTIHSLRADDPVLKTLLNVLDTFFLNPVETNLSLTETIIDLAACGFMDVSGWLLPDPSKYTYDEDDEDEIPSMTVSVMLPATQSSSQKNLDAVRRAHRHPRFPPAKVPRILTILEKLSRQANLYKDQIPRFADLLSNRHLELSAEPPQKPTLIRHRPPARSSFDDNSPSRSASPSQGKQSAFDSFAQRMFPDFSTPTRSNTPRHVSPRGRSSIERSGSGTSTPLKNAPSKIPSGFETPRIGSADRGTPRTDGRAFSSSPLRATAAVGIEESQARAFREVDRSILARQVGFPKETTAVPFPKLESSQQPSGGKDASKESRSHDGVGSEIERKKDDQGGELESPEVDAEEEKQVSVSHILTNTIVLQEFLLELAALVQVRAGLFGEVAFA